MNSTSHMERAKALLARWFDSNSTTYPNRVDIELSADEIVPAVATLVDGRWGYLVAITGLDPGVDSGSLWVLYHFAEGSTIVTFRVDLPRHDPHVPTIRHMVSLAGIYEQELSELLGVTIDGADFDGRLFLSEDWPSDVYPLRKDFKPV